MSEATKLTKEQLLGMFEEAADVKFAEIEERKKADFEDMRAEIAELKANKFEDKPQGARKKDGMDAVTFIQCLGVTRGDTQAAARFADKELGNKRVAKALGTVTAGSGGVLVEPEFASEFVDFLRAQTVVLESGARTLPMDSGILSLKRAAGGATAAYRGESINGAVSEPTTDDITLKAKILDVMTPVSNQLMRRSGGTAMEFVRDDLVDAARDKMDSSFIRSTGASDTPKGLLHWAKPANKFNETNAAGTTGGSTVAEIIGDLGAMIQKLMDGNIRMSQVGWLMEPRTWKRLFTAVDANSNTVFKGMLETNSLYGFPFKITTNIPKNLTAVAGSGAGTDAAELYLCDFFNIIVGETESLRVSVSEEASYDAGAGLISSFQRGETLIKVEMEHDLVARRSGAEIVVLESLTWGTV